MFPLPIAAKCKKSLDSTNCNGHEDDVYCTACHRREFGPKGYGFAGGAAGLSTESSVRRPRATANLQVRLDEGWGWGEVGEQGAGRVRWGGAGQGRGGVGWGGAWHGMAGRGEVWAQGAGRDEVGKYRGRRGDMG